MRQEAVAGIVLCVMGLAMLFISPNAWWTVAEKWKTEGGDHMDADEATEVFFKDSDMTAPAGVGYCLAVRKG
ncbi:MAG: hypothetical protein IKE24_11700 [Clostridia bacterium]|nr:hypothetical protein [Clostridia bacterium]